MKQKKLELWEFADIKKSKGQFSGFGNPSNWRQGPAGSKAGTVALGKQGYKAGMEGMEGSFYILQILPLKICSTEILYRRIKNIQI